MPQAYRTQAIAAVAVLAASLAGAAIAQGRMMRFHSETQSGTLNVVPATTPAGRNKVRITQTGTSRKITANGLPDHLVGRFPNSGNPNSIRPQRVSLSMPAAPRKSAHTTPLRFGWVFGVSVNGVVFDPLAAEFWQGDPRSGWSYDALGGAVPLGLDANHAHVQPSGSYHYHGIPTKLLASVGWRSDAHSPLVGYAADGFPIYALTGRFDGKVTPATSSWRLKSGTRPGGRAPDGRYDGAFNEDYTYVAGSGTLDACNGAWTVSAEYPQGTYAYFLTESYPVIPRCFAGQPDPSFRMNRR